MIVSATLRYTSKNLPPRCRKPREIDIIDTTEVNIAEVTGEQAPVAFRYNPGLASYEVRDGKPEPKTVEIRLHDGKLWMPRENQDAAEAVEVGHHYAWRTARSRAEVLADATTGALIDDADRAKVVAEAEKHAAGLLFVDGVLHCPAPGEPTWKVETSSGWGGSSREVYVWLYARLEHVDEAHIQPDRQFPANQYEAAMERASKRHKAGLGEAPTVQGTIEVLMPEAVKLRPHDLARRNEIARYVAEIERVAQYVYPRDATKEEILAAMHARLDELAAGWNNR